MRYLEAITHVLEAIIEEDVEVYVSWAFVYDFDTTHFVLYRLELI